jgi:SAM-dependent methyltransferase
VKRKRISEKSVAKHWDRNAPVWAHLVRRGEDAYRELFNNPAFLKFIGDLHGKTVLDAGCGEGYNTRILARAGAKMTGVDISRKMIALARDEEKRHPLGIRYFAGSFGDLSRFARASFDDAVSFMAMMDSPDFAAGAREIFRVLRPGGQFIFSILHPCFMTPGYGWIRSEKGECVKLTVAGYFDPTHLVERWTFSKGQVPKDAPPFEVPRFPKTLSEYLNALIDAGFHLKELAEPRPTVKACKGRPWLARFRKHAACFLYIRAQKPTEVVCPPPQKVHERGVSRRRHPWPGRGRG